MTKENLIITIRDYMFITIGVVLVAFGIQYLDQNNELKTPYQTSWGVSTRMIGALIMVHGDDRGLVLPPNIAPIKAVIIPIGKDEAVIEATNKVTNELKEAGITYRVDDSNKTPGFKFAEAEVKGYPVRIEIGKRDLENHQVTVVRRDTLEKIKYDVLDIAAVELISRNLLPTL